MGDYLKHKRIRIPDRPPFRNENKVKGKDGTIRNMGIFAPKVTHGGYTYLKTGVLFSALQHPKSS